MERDNDTLDAACLRVFGMVSAAVSHDLKNVLAIINESAGLLDDLALRAAKGIEIPADRLGSTTARILKQVKRGDAVLKNLNRYAHSTDAPILQGNVAETVALMADLATRQAAMKEIAITTEPAAVTNTTCQIYLETLCYLLLRHVIDTLPRKERVTITVAQEGTMIQIRLHNGQGLALIDGDRFPGEEERALLGWLKAEIASEPGAVSVRLPVTVG